MAAIKDEGEEGENQPVTSAALSTKVHKCSFTLPSRVPGPKKFMTLFEICDSKRAATAAERFQDQISDAVAQTKQLRFKLLRTA